MNIRIIVLLLYFILARTITADNVPNLFEAYEEIKTTSVLPTTPVAKSARVCLSVQFLPNNNPHKHNKVILHSSVFVLFGWTDLNYKSKPVVDPATNTIRFLSPFLWPPG